MRTAAFRAWLLAQGQAQSSVSTRVADARRVETHYGDLDTAFARDSFEEILGTLAYSTVDRAASRPNPSRLSIQGELYDSLASYRGALTAYRRFAGESNDRPSYTRESWAEVEFRDRYGEPIVDTNKMLGFALTDGRQVALQRDVRGTQVWLEGDPARQTIPAGEVRHYLPDQTRHSNLPPRLRHLPPGGVSPQRVSLIVVTDLPSLRRLLDWYAGKDGWNRAALDRYRRLFSARYPDFNDFNQTVGGYFDDERAYKNRLTALAKEAMDGGLPEQELGDQLLDILVGRAGAPSGLLGWRTDARLAELRKSHPGVIEAAAGRLARAEDVDGAIAVFVSDTWPILVEGQTSRPYSESRNLPTMLAALVHPHRAYGINTDPVQRTAQTLLGRRLLGWNTMTMDEYGAVLEMAEGIRRVMADEWGWAPQDLWDVQGFIWAVNRTDQSNLPDHDNTIDATRPEKRRMPTNLILYGPPGTGKTFATAREAVRLCDGAANVEESEVRERYAKLVAAGQVRFVTFHQSYSYEDFVEGLRPTTGEEGEDGASSGFSLQPVPGVFREIAALAEQAMRSKDSGAPFDMTDRRVFKMSLGRAGTEDHIFDAAIEGGYVVLGWGGDIDWTAFATSEAIHARWLELHPGANGYDANIVQTARFRADMREGDLVVVSYGNTRFRAIGEVIGPYAFEPTDERDYNHRRAVRWLFVPDEPLPISFYGKPFTMRSCYPLREDHLNREALSLLLPGAGEGDAAAPAQFVLICDEINRANISKVFGELITLIEPDKRIGGEYPLRLTLPYSKHSFGVPVNLHIIGTMNTADRSIALLDTALRRRFTFREMMPEPEHLGTIGALDLSVLLSKLNDRIEYLFDREHQIGHAY